MWFPREGEGTCGGKQKKCGWGVVWTISELRHSDRSLTGMVIVGSGRKQRSKVFTTEKWVAGERAGHVSVCPNVLKTGKGAKERVEGAG